MLRPLMLVQNMLLQTSLRSGNMVAFLTRKSFWEFFLDNSMLSLLVFDQGYSPIGGKVTNFTHDFFFRVFRSNVFSQVFTSLKAGVANVTFYSLAFMFGKYVVSQNIRSITGKWALSHICLGGTFSPTCLAFRTFSSFQ